METLQLQNNKTVPVVDIDICAEDLYFSARRNGSIQKEIQERILNSAGLDINRMPNCMVRCLARTIDGTSFSAEDPELTYDNLIENLRINGCDRLFDDVGDYFNPDYALPEYLVFEQDRSLGFIPEAQLTNHVSFILVYDLGSEQSSFESPSFDIKPFYTAFRNAIETNSQPEFFREKLQVIYRVNWK